jgi:hypothetical protein
MICGLVTAAGQGAFDARDATIAGALWSGIALLCLIAAYQRIFQGLDPARWGPYAIGLALLGVTGLDILPVLQVDYQHRHTPAEMLPSIEGWNEQVTAWLGSMLWVPHHIAALVACLIAFLLLWRDSEQPGRWPQPLSVVLAAAAMASAVGMSVYVTFTFASILVVWALLALIRKQPKVLAAVVAAGVLSLLIALPFLLELRSNEPVADGIHWQVRRFALFYDKLGPLGLISPEQTWKTTLYRLAFLPLNYFLELGVYFYAGILCCRRLWRKRPVSGRDLAAVAMLGASVAICTFLGSNVGDMGNDLGWRGFLPAQFVLLLWTAELLDDHVSEWRLRRRHYGALILLLAVGVSSTMLDLTLLRGWNLFRDAPLFNRLGETPDVKRRLGERYAALAATYAWIRSHTPANAVVEANPDETPFSYGLYAQRLALAMGGECEAYSGRSKDCAAIKTAVRPLFSGTASLQDFPDLCRAFPLDIVIVTDSDAVWPRKESWMQHYLPVYSSEFTKAFACRPPTLLP